MKSQRKEERGQRSEVRDQRSEKTSSSLTSDLRPLISFLVLVLLLLTLDLSAADTLRIPPTTSFTRPLLITTNATEAKVYLQISDGLVYTFDPADFDVTAATNVALHKTALSLTDLLIKGNTRSEQKDVGAGSGTFNVDAASSIEFSMRLTGNATITFTNWSDWHPLNLTITNTGAFVLLFGNTMYWVPNQNSTQVTNDSGAGAINVFHFFQATGGHIIASDPERALAVGSGGTVINATDGVLPYRSGAATFADSPLQRVSALNLGLNGATNILTTSGSDLIYTNSGTAKFRVKNAAGESYVDNDVTGGIAHFQGGTSTAWFANGNNRGIIVSDTTVVPSANNTLDLGNAGSLRWKDFALDGHVIWNGTTNNVWDLAGNGTPEGAVIAAVGSTYRRYDGSAGTTFYTKVTGTGNTGWSALAAATITTPVTIANGGTGTNSLGSVNAIPFNTGAGYLATDIAFAYDSGVQSLNIFRASGAVPYAQFTDTTGLLGTLRMWHNRVSTAGDDLTLEAQTAGQSVIGKVATVQGFKLSPNLSFVVGDGTSTTTRTNKFLYIPTSAGPPTGVPAAETSGTIPLDYDTVNSKLMAYNTAWLSVGGHWKPTSGSSSNSFTEGEVTASKMTSTNGFAVPGGGLFTSAGLNMQNSGNTVVVKNNSTASGSSLTLQGGTAANVGQVILNAGNTTRVTVNTNGALQTLYGRVVARFATATNYTLTVANYYVASTSTVTNTLPAISATLAGQEVRLKSTSGTTTVRPAGFDTIDGSAGDDVLTVNLSHRYVSDGVSNWEVN